MLIPRPVLDGVVAGRVTLAFRRWDRARAKAGALHRTAVGLVAVDAVDVVRIADITDADARAAGAASRAELLRFLRGRTGRVYRMRLRYAGADPRIALRAEATLSADDVAGISARLDRLDKASSHGAWTRAVLQLIAANEARRAPDLAEIRGLPTQPFKTDVRKLKELGLTESLDVGYRISPRGRAYLAATAD
ncbi:MAG: hypothetical protein J2P24_01550 [Streptosporangiales bacterium]|nr:hypothetical protein [Streptosporangiales bacterium]MBO0889531.1 hypothetical protein [Acidothermales bacterium]